jgi:hypothetical protein
MSNKNEYNYSELDRPYNDLMIRSIDDTSVVYADASLGTGMQDGFSSNEVSTPYNVSENVLEGKSLDNVWINSWIKSRNYKPKKQGFLIDGQRGYIECMELYVGDGGIIGGSLDIPDTTSSDSFHVDGSGNTWWGCNNANFNLDNDNAVAYILDNGNWKLGGDGKMGDTTGEYLQFDKTTKKFSIVQPEINQNLPADINLSGYWSFDEQTGTEAIDDTINANHGTIAGAVYIKGASGTGLDFDGATGSVLIADDTELQNIFDSGGSVSFWFKPATDGEGDNGRVFSKSSAVSCWVNSESGGEMKMTFEHTFSGTDYNFVTTSRIFTANTWYHCVITYTATAGEEAKLYVNGAEVTALTHQTSVGTRTTDVGSDLYIGNNSADSRTFDGIIDEFRLYDATLTDDNAYALFKNPAGVSSQGVKQLGGVFKSASSGNRIEIEGNRLDIYDANGFVGRVDGDVDQAVFTANINATTNSRGFIGVANNTAGTVTVMELNTKGNQPGLYIHNDNNNLNGNYLLGVDINSSHASRAANFAGVRFRNLNKGTCLEASSGSSATGPSFYSGHANIGGIGWQLDFNNNSNDSNSLFINKTSTGTGYPLQIVNSGVTDTNFKKIGDLAGVSLYISDQTDPDGNLTGVQGDICFNGPGGVAYYCDSSGTNWTAM